jgi:glycosyltransferase involved in cell wall biosynthesis
LLEGFDMALAHEPTLRLEVVGEGPLAARVIASRLSPERLVYRGHLTHRETMNVMAGWDVGAAPYPGLEDFYFSPLKVGEYMAAGSCPVASDLPVLRDLLAGGERGILVEPGSAESFAAALVELARNRTRASALGERARAYALEHLSWSENASCVLETLATPAGAAR